MNKEFQSLKLFNELNANQNMIVSDKAISFLNYLSDYYTDAQLSDLVLEIYNQDETIYIYYLLELLSVVDSLGNKEFHLDFKECKCSIEHIYCLVLWYGEYQTIINCPVEEFQYPENTLDKAMCIDEIDFILPRDNMELNSYSKELNNSLWGYSKSIINHELNVFIVKEKGKLLFAIEVLKHGAVSVINSSNNEVSKKYQTILDKWMKKFNLKIVTYSIPIVIEYEA